MWPRHDEKQLKVAIIGGGPGGLGAAIELSRLPFVTWDLYEKRERFSEIGGGFTLQPQTWRLLQSTGVAENITENDYFRSTDGFVEQRRQVRISFDTGAVDDVDLIVAADGIRSRIRNHCFPDHKLSYNGQSVYRTIVSKTDVLKIKGIPWAATFWKHTSGLYVFTCPLGDDDFEVTARILRPKGEEEPVSWGRPFSLHHLLHEYDDFCEPIRQILRIAAEGDTQEFALFSGPHLEHVTCSGNIAFVGDASHAMLGNFGSGAGFALEDVYTLGRTLEWASSAGKTLPEALNLFDRIRSPYYERLHQAIKEFASIKTALRAERLPLDEEIAERVRRISKASQGWMFYYQIDKVVDEALREEAQRDANEGSPTKYDRLLSLRSSIYAIH
ncbi:hypothetical protein CCUS01_02809 [Colletotrichum cuscutae]|uniref:FAD-binding domain-containing protein n=1 Tax=Colletotrichum cuscutae TaxID=1209917 RepID=A0AAI9YC69_9PEZI|nr:hypothetical protein CCUS01_02809 [Colletotrichum cuscutae]